MITYPIRSSLLREINISEDTQKIRDYLDKNNFLKLVNKEELDKEIKNELIEKNFIYEESEELFSTKKYLDLRKYKGHLLIPTILHIFVVSKNCNFNCIYCQAGHLNQKEDYHTYLIHQSNLLIPQYHQSLNSH